MTNKKTAKRALFASVLSLLLCVSMLVGSTFAWFTDSATTNVNKIQAGTLKIDLVDEDENSVKGQTLNFVKAEEGKDEEILWEPGCTYNLPTLYVKNLGNLAFKYQVVITGIAGDAKLNEAIEWTIDYGYGKGKTEGHMLGNSTLSAPINISGHMRDDAGNEFQGLSIDGISITVLATQDTVEYDSENNTYDENADYVAKYSSGTHTIEQDFRATKPNGTALLVEGEDTNVTFVDGYVDGGKGGDNNAVQVNPGATLTIKDGYFTVGADANGLGNSTIYSHGGNIIIEGGFFESEASYNNKYYVLNVKNNSSGTITVKGGTFVNCDPAGGDDTGNPNNFVADGYTVISEAQANGDTWYTVVPASQTALQETVNNRDSVVLGDDLTMTDPLTVQNNKLTLDMNDKTLTNEQGIWVDTDTVSKWSYLSVGEGAEVTLTGNGTFQTKEDDCYAIDIQDGGKLTIEDGTYIGNITAVYVYEGELIIKGGTFDIQQLESTANGRNGYEYLINCKDAYYNGGTAKVSIMGGSFKNFNPADNAAEGAHTNFVAPGYKVVERADDNDIWYDVVAE